MQAPQACLPLAGVLRGREGLHLTPLVPGEEMCNAYSDHSMPELWTPFPGPCPGGNTPPARVGLLTMRLPPGGSGSQPETSAPSLGKRRGTWHRALSLL